MSIRRHAPRSRSPWSAPLSRLSAQHRRPTAAIRRARAAADAAPAGRAEAAALERPAASGSSSSTKCRSCRSTCWSSAGAADDPAGKFGLASLTAAMLDEGAGTRSALEIADAVDFLGASLDTGSGVRLVRRAAARPGRAAWPRRCRSWPTWRCGPTFPRAELERLRRERLTAILQARDEPAHDRRRSPSARALRRPTATATPTFGTRRRRQVRSRADDLRAFYRAALPARQRHADRRRRRRRPGDGDAAAGEALRHVAGAAARRRCRADAAAPRPNRRRARSTSWTSRARAQSRDPHRVGRRAALDARLLPDRGDEHDPRRLVHLAAQPEPARAARLHLRRRLGLRHAPSAPGRSPPAPACRPTRRRRRAAESSSTS